MLTLVTTANFPPPLSPQPILATFGAAAGYTPTAVQTSLVGTPVYQMPGVVQPTTVATGIISYSFLIPNTVSAPFTFGEILFTNASGSTVYAIGVLNEALSRVPSESVTVTVFFDVSQVPVQAFGLTSATINSTFLTEVSSVNSLGPVNRNSVAGNTFLVHSPVVPADTMLAFSSYARSSVPNDFDSWSFSGYALAGQGLVLDISGPNVELNILLADQVFPGQYILQTEQYTRIAENITVNPVTGTTMLVQLDITALAVTSPGTKYKLFQFVGASTQANALVSGLTVTPQQINQMAAVSAETVLRSDGLIPLAGNLNLAGNKLVNSGDAINPGDLVNLKVLQDNLGLSGALVGSLSAELASLSADVESLQSSAASLITRTTLLENRLSSTDKLYVWPAAPSLSTGVPQKVLLNQVTYDTNSIFVSALSRVVPKKAGYYQITGRATRIATAVGQILSSAIVVNGSSTIFGTTTDSAGYSLGVTLELGGPVSALVFLNGTTDYVELFTITTAVGLEGTNNPAATYLSVVGPL